MRLDTIPLFIAYICMTSRYASLARTAARTTDFAFRAWVASWGTPSLSEAFEDLIGVSLSFCHLGLAQIVLNCVGVRRDDAGLHGQVR